MSFFFESAGGMGSPFSRERASGRGGEVLLQDGANLAEGARDVLRPVHGGARYDGVGARAGGQRYGLRVDPAVRFLGFVNYWEAIRLLGACDIVCIPSRNEPFGLVLLEAWASGKPVVATNVGGMSENIDNFVNGVKVYTNPDSIAWGINYVLNTPGEMQKLGANGLAKVKEFAWEKVVDKYLESYKIAMKK